MLLAGAWCTACTDYYEHAGCAGAIAYAHPSSRILKMFRPVTMQNGGD